MNRVYNGFKQNLYNSFSTEPAIRLPASNFGQNDKKESINTLFAQVSRIRRRVYFFPQTTRSLVFNRDNENLYLPLFNTEICICH